MVTISKNELRAQIRSSRVMDAVLKRYWLRVLPYLSAQECSSLGEILQQEASAIIEPAANRATPSRAPES